jgi:hypothetical protein
VILPDDGGNRTAMPAIVRGIRHRGLQLVALTAKPSKPQNATSNPQLDRVAFQRRAKVGLVTHGRAPSPFDARAQISRELHRPQPCHRRACLADGKKQRVKKHRARR